MRRILFSGVLALHTIAARFSSAVVSVVLKFMFVVVLGALGASHAFAGPESPGRATREKPQADYSSDRIDNLVSRARQLIGTPYRWGGNSVREGFDCSGLLVYLFRSEAGVRLPRTTASMLQSKVRTIARQDLESGDAVFFRHNGGARRTHVGIYIGEGRFIHAPRAGKTVRMDSLSNRYWGRSFLTAKRFH